MSQSNTFTRSLEEIARRLPGAPLLRLAGRAPWWLQGQLLEQLLNPVFLDARQRGELDFLEGRVVEIRITDLDVVWKLSMAAGRIAVRGPVVPAETVFCADVSTFLALANRRADPDTLFFQRRLVIEGDTELGLHLKNWLDTLEPESLPSLLRLGLGLADRVLAVA